MSWRTSNASSYEFLFPVATYTLLLPVGALAERFFLGVLRSWTSSESRSGQNRRVVRVVRTNWEKTERRLTIYLCESRLELTPILLPLADPNSGVCLRTACAQAICSNGEQAIHRLLAATTQRRTHRSLGSDRQ